MIFKNKLGVFEFNDKTSLALAKLVRDTVTGQYFNPKPGTARLTDEQSCYHFIDNDSSHVLSGIRFTLEMH